MCPSKAVELAIVNSIYRRLVTKLIDKFGWLKSPENLVLYNDARAHMNYMNAVHGGVFR